jgi:hypothetical protein
LEATVRPSFAFYNTFSEIDVFLDAVRRIAEGGAPILSQPPTRGRPNGSDLPPVSSHRDAT